MQIITQWINYYFRPQKAFNEHFEIKHFFHGVKHHHISEAYTIKPVSPMAIQLFYDGIHFPNVDLHLKCKIINSHNEIRVIFQIIDPNISKYVIKEVKAHILHQLQLFNKRYSHDPTYRYVREFCNNCLKENSKPFNLCVRTCQYEAKPKN